MQPSEAGYAGDTTPDEDYGRVRGPGVRVGGAEANVQPAALALAEKGGKPLCSLGIGPLGPPEPVVHLRTRAKPPETSEHATITSC